VTFISKETFRDGDAWLEATDDAQPPTGVTAGSPGSFTPPGSAIPRDMAHLRTLGSLGQTTPWLAGQYVVLGDSSHATWISTSACPTWCPPWTKSPTMQGMCFPAEPTVTAQDQTNADKLPGLGYVASPNNLWLTGRSFYVGMFQFHGSGANTFAPGAAP